MKERLKKMLEVCGNRVTVFKQNGIEKTCYAVIQPLLYKNKMYVEMQPSELGKTDDGCYKYLGPYDVIFSDGDIIKFSGNRFVVQRSESVRFAGETLYVWAILRPYLSEDAYGE